MRLLKDRNLADHMSTVRAGGLRVTGNLGLLFIALKPRDQRKLSADQIVPSWRPQLAGVVGLKSFPQNPPPIRIGGMLTKAQYQYSLRDTAVARYPVRCRRSEPTLALGADQASGVPGVRCL